MTLQIPGILLYDGDCGFCTMVTTKLEDRLGATGVQVQPWRLVDTARYGVTPDEAAREIHWVDRLGGVRGGADAILSWWRTGAGGWVILGRLLALPGMIQLTRAGYRFIARHRYQLPGATAACRVHRT